VKKLECFLVDCFLEKKKRKKEEDGGDEGVPNSDYQQFEQINLKFLYEFYLSE
jgi:hypothetical protein